MGRYEYLEYGSLARITLLGLTDDKLCRSGFESFREMLAAFDSQSVISLAGHFRSAPSLTGINKLLALEGTFLKHDRE